MTFGGRLVRMGSNADRILTGHHAEGFQLLVEGREWIGWFDQSP